MPRFPPQRAAPDLPQSGRFAHVVLLPLDVIKGLVSACNTDPPRATADLLMARGVRVRLALLLAYLAVPIDLMPDFLPVAGYADDAIIVALARRRSRAARVLRRSGGIGPAPAMGSPPCATSPACPALVHPAWPGSRQPSRTEVPAPATSRAESGESAGPRRCPQRPAGYQVSSISSSVPSSSTSNSTFRWT